MPRVCRVLVLFGGLGTLLLLPPGALASPRTAHPTGTGPHPDALGRADTRQAPKPAPKPGAAAEQLPQAPSRLRRTEVTISAGYGAAVRYNDSELIDLASVVLRWTKGSRHSRFLGGQPAWGFELLPYINFDQKPDAWGAGWHVLFEDRFRPGRSVRPMLRLGAGMTYQNTAVPPGETRYNFSLFLGGGLSIATGPHTSLNLEYRLHHISNADTGNRNPGINAHTALVGVSWRY